MRGLFLNAAETGEKLEMIYLSNKNEISQRVVKIVSVSNDSFTAYCYTKKKLRTFKICNVLSIGKRSRSISKRSA